MLTINIYPYLELENNKKFNIINEKDKDSEEKTRTKQKIVLKNIDAILKEEQEKNKAGRYSLEIKLIKKLKSRGYSDIAIYLALALAQTKIKPKWSFNDIINEIEEPTLIDPKYHKYLMRGYIGNESVLEQKQIAIEMWKQIIENETKQQIKINNIFPQLQLTQNKKKFKFAHELLLHHPGDDLSAIKDAIISSFELFKKIKNIDPNFKFQEKYFFNFDPNSTITTTQYINALIGIGNLYLGAPNSLLQTLDDIINTYDLDDRILTHINRIKQTLNKARDVLWPEYDKPIKSLDDLKKYFNILTSSAEKARAEKILKQYKHKKEIKSIKELEKKFDELIQKSVNKLETIPMTIEPDKFHKTAHELAKKIIKENDWIKEYVIKNESLPKDADEDDIITELIAIMTFEYGKRKKHLGRRRNIWNI